METKKNPASDLHHQSGKFFLIGLSISIALIISAFEWSTPKTKVITDRVYDPVEQATIELQAHREEPILEITPAPIAKKIKVPVFVIDETPDVEIRESDDPIVLIDEIPVVNIFPIPNIPKEEGDTAAIVFSPEVAPEPVGGFKTFYKTIRTSLQYPRLAQRQNVAGQVFVEFVVSRSGTPTQVRVLKGIGAGCDEEAVRVIAASKWEPGKQRGKLVKVRMVIPISFKMAN